MRTLAAFRVAATRETPANEDGGASLVASLLIPPRCAGVFAIEFRRDVVVTESTRAAATIITAAIAQLVARVKATQVQARLSAKRAPARTAYSDPAPQTPSESSWARSQDALGLQSHASAPRP